MRPEDLAAKLTPKRPGEFDVVVQVGHVDLDITSVFHARSADRIIIDAADPTGTFTVTRRYLPDLDDSVMDVLVTELRNLWRDHRSSRPQWAAAGPAPDFYAWTVAILTRLYHDAYLRVPLPDEADPDAFCRCGNNSPAMPRHRPRQHEKCVYRREVTP